MAEIQITVDLRLAAADYIERAGYARHADDNPSPVTRAVVQDGQGNWLPRVDVYGALLWCAGGIDSGPCGWAYCGEFPLKRLFDETWRQLGAEVGEDELCTWEYDSDRTVGEILAVLRSSAS